MGAGEMKKGIKRKCIKWILELDRTTPNYIVTDKIWIDGKKFKEKISSKVSQTG